jgi:hypothetical protein
MPKQDTQTRIRNPFVDTNTEIPLDMGKKSISKTKINTNTPPSSPTLKTKDPSKIKLDPSQLTPDQRSNISKFSTAIPDKLKQLGIDPEDDIDSDITTHTPNTTGAIPVKPKIENLPAIISKELTLHGTEINPEFTMVKHLPGYMQGSIRVFGREVMKTFAPGTPLEKIQVIATIGGLNSKEELTAVAGYLKNHGIKNDTLSGKIVDMLPGGYSPDIRVYDALGYRWLIVKDFAGIYIYAGENPNPPYIKNNKTSTKTITQEMYILKSKLQKLI